MILVWCTTMVVVAWTVLQAGRPEPDALPWAGGEAATRDPAAALPSLTVSSTSWFDGLHLVVRFAVQPAVPDLTLAARSPGSASPDTSPSASPGEPPGLRYHWDLGNGLAAEGSLVYGVYAGNLPSRVRVQARDQRGRPVGSGEFWTDQLPASHRLAGQDRAAGSRLKPGSAGTGALSGTKAASPRTGRQSRYLTLSEPGALLAVEGGLLEWHGEGTLAHGLDHLGQAGPYHIYQALQPGYQLLRTDAGLDYWLFVSPLPSRHLDRPDMDWYLTQWNTATLSNCGPAVTAMAVQWARGLPVDVVTVRGLMGWEGNGATSLQDMGQVLNYYAVGWKSTVLAGPRQLFDILDSGHLVAVSYDMAGLAEVADPAHNLLGQHYSDQGGHYLILKGYSLDRRYVVVYDPIPSDWGSNSRRYGDGHTMLGRNRYFPVDQLWPALRSRNCIEIFP